MIKKIICNLKTKINGKSSISGYRKKGVKIGNNCHILNCSIDEGHAYLIEIGNNCTLTNCTVLAHDASTKMHIGKSKIGCVFIGDNTFVGWGAIILPNVRIGSNCIIGAGCVVAKDVPDNSIAVGNPGRIIGKTDEFIEKNKKNMKTHPVFNKYWKQKSKMEKENEKEKLLNSFGYDE